MCFGNRKPPRHLIIHDQYHKPTKSFGLLWMIIALAILIGSMMISLSVNANIKLVESEAGQLLFQNSKGLYEPSLHIESEAELDMTKQALHVKVSQTFSNPTNDWKNGVYIFSVPEKSFLHHVEVKIGERVITGTAPKFLSTTVSNSESKTPQSTAINANIFSHKVWNIAPRQEIQITVFLLQDLGREPSNNFPNSDHVTLHGDSHGNPPTSNRQTLRQNMNKISF